MSELEFHYGSVDIPDEQRDACAALPEDDLKEAAHGSQDLSLTYAARQEIGRRIVPKLVERHLNQVTD